MNSNITDHAVTLLLPELLPDGDPLQEYSQYKFLQRLHTEAKPADSLSSCLESAVLKWFHGNNAPQQNCAAMLGYRLDHSSATASGQCYRADPVYQQMDINHAVLADRSLIDVCDTESKAIIDDLNQHFTDDGVRFENGGDGRWYCFFETELTVETIPPGTAAGRNVSLVMPTGAGARRWRGWLAEIEMLLHAHPVNVARAEQGRTVINSLWLWGEGNISDLGRIDVMERRVYTQNFYTRSLAEYHQVPCMPLEEFRHATAGQSALVVEERLLSAGATGNQELRATLLQSLETQLFPVLYRGLKKGGWSHASVWLGDDRWLTLTPPTFWTAVKSLLKKTGLQRG